MFNMLLAVACFATLISLLVVLTFREKPGALLFSFERQHTSSSTVGDALIGNVGSPESRELGMMEQVKLCMRNK